MVYMVSFATVANDEFRIYIFYLLFGDCFRLYMILYIKQPKQANPTAFCNAQKPLADNIWFSMLQLATVNDAGSYHKDE